MNDRNPIWLQKSARAPHAGMMEGGGGQRREERCPSDVTGIRDEVRASVSERQTTRERLRLHRPPGIDPRRLPA